MSRRRPILDYELCVQKKQHLPKTDIFNKYLYDIYVKNHERHINHCSYQEREDGWFKGNHEDFFKFLREKIKKKWGIEVTNRQLKYRLKMMSFKKLIRLEMLDLAHPDFSHPNYPQVTLTERGLEQYNSVGYCPYLDTFKTPMQCDIDWCSKYLPLLNKQHNIIPDFETFDEHACFLVPVSDIADDIRMKVFKRDNFLRNTNVRVLVPHP